MKVGKLEINLDELSEFLVEAKKNTYASGSGEVTLPDGSKQLKFNNGKFYYTDTYSGYYSFAGNESVQVKDETGSYHESDFPIIWQMNYFGEIDSKFIGDEDIAKATYDFLKRTLSNVSLDRPFRGPYNLLSEDKNWRYSSFSDSGMQFITAFEGGESIASKENGKIYSGNYHGGIIIPR